jgi:hypothetical protein
MIGKWGNDNKQIVERLESPTISTHVHKEARQLISNDKIPEFLNFLFKNIKKSKMKTTAVFRLCFFLFLSAMETQCQNPQKTEPLKANFKISACQVSYKGKKLEMNTRFEVWRKKFGNYDRKVKGCYYLSCFIFSS